MTKTIQKSNLKKSENLSGYLFLLPWLLGLLLFKLIPIIASMYFSFTNYDMFTTPEWVGLDNYIHMFTNDSQFVTSLQVTLGYVFMSVPLELAFALFIAVLLKKGIRGLRIYRAVYYIPSLLGSSVAISILWREVFGFDGIVNTFLAFLGFETISWLGSPDYALFTVVLLKIWQFGSPMLIFLAGLQQIPVDYYEAAMVDGASKVRQFFSITLPLLTPIILFNTIMQMINSFKSFTPAFIISGGNGAPADSLLFYTLYLYNKGFNYYQMGYASALAWVLLIIIAVFTLLTFKFSDKWVYYSD